MRRHAQDARLQSQHRCRPGNLQLLAFLVILAACGTVRDTDGATCQDGKLAFCKCRGGVAQQHPQLCKDIVAQCQKSFCQPLCLRMAWKPTIRVRCDLAPEWAECKHFREQVMTAAKAITAQFQAHVCSELELGCCTNETKLLNYVENHVFADLYPRGHLPIDMCLSEEERRMHAHLSPTTSAEEAVERMLHPEQAKPRRSRHDLCLLCEKVIETDIDTHEDTVCIPPHSSLKKVIPNSLHERCLFLADMIGNMKSRLVAQFREEVCSCTGCCNGGCYFHTKAHEPWLHAMVEDITSSFQNVEL